MRPQINFAPLCLTKSSELDHNLSISWDSIFVAVSETLKKMEQEINAQLQAHFSLLHNKR